MDNNRRNVEPLNAFVQWRFYDDTAFFEQWSGWYTVSGPLSAANARRLVKLLRREEGPEGGCNDADFRVRVAEPFDRVRLTAAVDEHRQWAGRRGTYVGATMAGLLRLDDKCRRWMPMLDELPDCDPDAERRELVQQRQAGEAERKRRKREAENEAGRRFGWFVWHGSSDPCGSHHAVAKMPSRELATQAAKRLERRETGQSEYAARPASSAEEAAAFMLDVERCEAEPRNEDHPNVATDHELCRQLAEALPQSPAVPAVAKATASAPPRRQEPPVHAADADAGDAGPLDGCRYTGRGVTIELQPKPWKLVDFLHRSGGEATDDEAWRAVWDDDAVAEKNRHRRLTATVSRANNGEGDELGGLEVCGMRIRRRNAKLILERLPDDGGPAVTGHQKVTATVTAESRAAVTAA